MKKKRRVPLKTYNNEGNNRKTIFIIGVLTKWRFAAVFLADGIINRQRESMYLQFGTVPICPLSMIDLRYSFILVRN